MTKEIRNKVAKLIDKGLSLSIENDPREILYFIEAMEIARESKYYETSNSLEEQLEIAPLYREIKGFEDKLDFIKNPTYVNIVKEDLETYVSRKSTNN